MRRPRRRKTNVTRGNIDALSDRQFNRISRITADDVLAVVGDFRTDNDTGVWFEGRRTAIVVPSGPGAVKKARKKKQRGSDRVRKARRLSDQEQKVINR